MATYFTSQIPTFVAVSPEESVVIRLYREQRVVFSTTLYTYMSRAYVRDLRSIVEQDMREAKMCTELYELTMEDRNGEETISSFTAVFCEIAINKSVNSFIENHFLTTSSCMICSRIPNTLAYLAWAQEKVQLSKCIVYRDKDEKVGVYRETPRTVSSDGYVHYIITDPTGYANLGTILSITVTLNKRSYTYYYTDDDSGFKAFYKNPFNVLELIQLPGMTTSATKIERSEAVILQRTSFYDQHVVDAFEFQSAPIPHALARHALELATSQEVFFADRYFEDTDELPPILITDADISASDKRGGLSTIKFSFRYDDNVLHTSIPDAPGQPFNSVYQIPYT